MNTEKIKQHLKDHKELYIGIGIGVGLAVVAAIAFSKNDKQIVDSFNFLKINSPHESTTVLVRRGHPGNIIRCDQTGELFASQNRAADVLGLSRSNLSEHLRGRQVAVSGLTFTKIGEAA